MAAKPWSSLQAALRFRVLSRRGSHAIDGLPATTSGRASGRLRDFGAIFTPWGIAIEGITAAIVLAYKAWENWDTIIGRVKDGIEWFKNLPPKTLDWFKSGGFLNEQGKKVFGHILELGEEFRSNGEARVADQFRRRGKQSNSARRHFT